VRGCHIILFEPVFDARPDRGDEDLEPSGKTAGEAFGGGLAGTFLSFVGFGFTFIEGASKSLHLGRSTESDVTLLHGANV
jgi:hypothetical protein